jgi:2-phosphosulfolactate phosphatase
VRQVHLFATVGEARAAAAAPSGNPPRLLCGEERCLKPQGFDLGNSPGQFTTAHAGADVFLCTTNGTCALLASRGADVVLVAALINASAVTRRIIRSGLDATLVCAGTNGAVAMEDVLGAGAVVDALAGLTDVHLESDIARMALELFRSCRSRLQEVLRTTRGGMNVVEAGLEEDIGFAARLDALDIVGVASGDPLIVRPAAQI